MTALSHSSAATKSAVAYLFTVLTLLLPLKAQPQTLPAVKEPFDVKAGSWEITETITHGVDDPRQRQYEQMILNMPPEVRDKILANAPKLSQNPSLVKPTSKTYKYCVLNKELQTGTLLNTAVACNKRDVISSAQKLASTCDVGNIKPTNSTFDRIDAEHFGATTQAYTGTSQRTEVTTTLITAKWLGTDCGFPTEDHPSTGAADILSFLPRSPEAEQSLVPFGQYFRYTWRSDTIPTMSFWHGLPGLQKQTQQGPAYLNGTDGQFIYVSLTSAAAFCSGSYYKIDRNGNPTRIPEVPLGLRGGHDELNGPSMHCSSDPGPKPTIQPLSGYYVLSPTTQDRWPADTTRLFYLDVKGDELSLTELRRMRVGQAEANIPLPIKTSIFHGKYTSTTFITDNQLPVTVASPTQFSITDALVFKRLDDAVQRVP